MKRMLRTMVKYSMSMPINHRLLLLRLHRQDKAPRSVKLLVFDKSENLLLVLQWGCNVWCSLWIIISSVHHLLTCMSRYFGESIFTGLYEVGYFPFYYLLLLKRRETRWLIQSTKHTSHILPAYISAILIVRRLMLAGNVKHALLTEIIILSFIF